MKPESDTPMMPTIEVDRFRKRGPGVRCRARAWLCSVVRHEAALLIILATTSISSLIGCELKIAKRPHSRLVRRNSRFSISACAPFTPLDFESKLITPPTGHVKAKHLRNVALAPHLGRYRKHVQPYASTISAYAKRCVLVVIPMVDTGGYGICLVVSVNVV
jgi:hypothetical protein